MKINTFYFALFFVILSCDVFANPPSILGAYEVAPNFDWPLKAKVTRQSSNEFIELFEGGKTAYTGVLRRLSEVELSFFNAKIKKYVNAIPDKGLKAYGFLYGNELKECWLSEGSSWLAGICEVNSVGIEKSYSLMLPDMCSSSCCVEWCLVPAVRQ
jgi:hypothetical protein